LGQNNLTLTFDFISMGSALLDNASVWYNAGAGWNLLNPSIKSVNCISGQGQWTAATMALPPATWNVPSLRIGFNWTNNDDGVGTDPSVAINNVQVTAPGSLTGSPVFCTRIDTITITQPSQMVLGITGYDVTCNGAADGSAVVTHTGGTPGYSVLWSNSMTGDSISGLSGGSYTATVTDNNGCSDTISVFLNEPAAIIPNLTMDSVSCNGGNDGCAYVSATGGPSGQFTYLWSNGSTNDTICGLTAGTYVVTITDTTGGGGTQNILVYNETFDPAPAWTLNVPTGPNGADNNFWVINDNEGGVLPPGCGVASNGNNTLHITSVFCPTCGAAYDAGGLCGILFCPETNMRAESPLINTTGFNNLTLTFDFISMGDALLDNASVWYNDGLGWNLLAPSIKSVNCISGQGQWTASSFALPASTWNIPNLRIGFNWTNNDDGVGTDPSVAINNVQITSTVTVTGGNNCTLVDSIEVLEPTPVTVTISRTDAFCSQPNGTATATGSGGTGSHTYVWNTTPTQSGATATGLTPGTYTVTVTDANGCTTTGDVTIQDRPGPTITVNSITQVSCFGGNNGIATATTSSGTPPVTITWGTIPQQTGNQATGLTAGTYSVWATDSAGCADTVQFTVTQPSQLAVSVTTVGAICNLPNGSATATGNGGTPPYSFAWSNNQVGPSASNLGQGTYTVTVTDNNGCQATASFTITQAGSPILTLTSFNDITCNGGADGSITVSASAGVGPYTFLWSNGQVTATAVNLAAGTYSVTVTDQNGCQDHLTHTLIEPTAISGTVVTTPNGCNLTNPNGTAGVIATGGTPPYGYVWSSVPAQNGPYATGLAPGTYNVTITDARGCTLVLSGTVGQIPEPVVTAGADASFCEGEGGALISAVGSSGTPGYYYSWWCASPPCGLDSINDNDPVANPPSSQWYYVQVTDTNGCTSNIDSLFVTVLPKPIVDAGPDIILCGDAAPCEILTPTITGAPGPYTFRWMPSTGLNDSTIMNPCARPDTTTIYALVVTAGNGCESDYTTTDTLATVTVFVNPIPVANAGPDRDICLGDSTQLQGIGTDAGPVYDFEWTPSDGLSDSTAASPWASPAITTDYTLVVWSNGCPSYGDTVQVRVHTLPTVDAGWDREICPGQDTLLDASAGGDSTATYSFHWWPAAGIVGSDSVEDVHVAPLQTTTYYVIATSNFGCGSHIDSATVHVRPAPLPDAGPNLSICPGDSIQLQASYYFTTPDSAPVSQIYFGWTPAAAMSDSTELNPWVWPDVSTMYTLDIRYSVCSYQDSVLVIVGPPALAQVLPDTTVICGGDSVLLDASGSIGQNIYWSPTTGLSDPTSLTPIASPSGTTTYTLVAGDGFCNDTTSFTISVLPTPTAGYLSSLTSGCVPLTVQFTDVSAGAVNYIWNFGDGSPVSNIPQPTHVFDAVGNYTVSLTVEAPGGCSDEVHTIQVNVTDVAVAEFGSTPDFPVQLSFPNTLVQFEDQSPNAAEWYWDFGDGFTSTETDPNHTYSAEGEYFVTLMIHTANGCMGEVTHGPFIVVTPELFIPNVFSPNGDGINDVFQPQYTGDQPFTCKVFDRWGVSLWETVNKTAGWSGKNQKGEDVVDGVYFYVAKVGNREFAGEVTLVR
jgi:gliding motility-associated-like protein